MRLFELVSPGLILVALVAFAGTFVWGLTFAIPFAVGAVAVDVGEYLDKYGLESE